MQTGKMRNFAQGIITERYGIQLEPIEVFELAQHMDYHESERSQRDYRRRSQSGLMDAVNTFMMDSFGMADAHELRLLGILGTKEFKEYCRRNVGFWRDQRSLS